MTTWLIPVNFPEHLPLSVIKPDPILLCRYATDNFLSNSIENYSGE